ncbi:MAG: hypothetical protein ACRD34_06810 [Bryobacteraceae bacterium]
MRASAARQIANTLGAVAEVEGVYLVSGEGEGVRVVTVVDREDDAVYRRIYARELELARKLPGAHFDFSVIARRGRPVEQIVGDTRPVWERSSLSGDAERAF